MSMEQLILMFPSFWGVGLQLQNRECETTFSMFTLYLPPPRRIAPIPAILGKRQQPTLKCNYAVPSLEDMSMFEQFLEMFVFGKAITTGVKLIY